MKIIYYICAECGSDDLVWDAHACWDTENQCMELANIFDECRCNKCEHPCTPVKTEKQPARIAVEQEVSA